MTPLLRFVVSTLVAGALSSLVWLAVMRVFGVLP